MCHAGVLGGTTPTQDKFTPENNLSSTHKITKVDLTIPRLGKSVRLNSKKQQSRNVEFSLEKEFMLISFSPYDECEANPFSLSTLIWHS